MVYSIDELKRLVIPIAKRYDLCAVYLFGSYARGEANDCSNIDILIDRTDSKIKGMFDMGGLYNDLQEQLGKEIDLVTTAVLEQRSTAECTPWFIENLKAEMMPIYEQK